MIRLSLHARLLLALGLAAASTAAAEELAPLSPPDAPSGFPNSDSNAPRQDTWDGMDKLIDADTEVRDRELRKMQLETDFPEASEVEPQPTIETVPATPDKPSRPLTPEEEWEDLTSPPGPTPRDGAKKIPAGDSEPSRGDKGPGVRRKGPGTLPSDATRMLDRLERETEERREKLERENAIPGSSGRGKRRLPRGGGALPTDSDDLKRPRGDRFQAPTRGLKGGPDAATYVPLPLDDLPDFPGDLGVNGSESTPLHYLDPYEIQGPSGLRSPTSPQKKRVLFDMFGGAGPNFTQTGQASLSLRLGDWIWGVAYERAQWLDEKTNTGKFIQSLYFDGCAAMSLDSAWFSIQPCYRYGSGDGVYKERGPLNDIVERQVEREVFKFFGRFIALVPLWGDARIAVEGVSGYSEDPFLYGPFAQVTIRTPLLGLSIGAESYAGQRNAALLGWSWGLIEIND